MVTQKVLTVSWSAAKTDAGLFASLLGRGFAVDVRTGTSVRELLCRQFGIPAAVVEDRIQTVFLDGSAVDDLDAALVAPGATLALSAAMPGLAGATLRRGGFFSAMRSQITHRNPATRQIDDGQAPVTVKLFNLTVPELGPLFLARGIRVRGRDLQEFLAAKPDSLLSRWAPVYLDGRDIAWRDMDVNVAGEILLTVEMA